MPSPTFRIRPGLVFTLAAASALALASAAPAHETGAPHGGHEDGRAWQPGDHHVHSQFSVDWKPSSDPAKAPEPVVGGDSNNTIPTNARMAQKYGLSWMAATDHGGPNHSRVSRDLIYPEVLKARREVPDLALFLGLELNTPGADHSSIIVPNTPQERDDLTDLERRFDKFEAWPVDPARDQESRMVEALTYMKALPRPPVVIAHHPSRSAKGLGQYGQTAPAELRDWNDAAPRVAIGMEGAPGHQAGALNPDGSPRTSEARGAYRQHPTYGGFDQMTARVGGFWDSMLGEGRRWWITATSDSHRHYTDGGIDFWPGEYAKTYVLARKSPDDILDGLRSGRVFVTTGDLVSSVDLEVRPVARGAAATGIGGEVTVARGQDVRITLRVRDPAGENFGGRSPEVKRIDLIRGDLTGPAPGRSADANPTTRVERRFTGADWVREGEVITLTTTLRNVQASGYIRLRGTGTGDAEPAMDVPGENPWDDLWFYANPVFIKVR
jgi:hypothetical protein